MESPKNNFEYLEDSLEREVHEITERFVKKLEPLDPENAQIKELFVEWMDHVDGFVKQERKNIRLPIYRNFQLARLYMAIGDIEGAIECLVEAHQHADAQMVNNPEVSDVKNLIWKRLGEIEGWGNQ